MCKYDIKDHHNTVETPEISDQIGLYMFKIQHNMRMCVYVPE